MTKPTLRMISAAALNGADPPPALDSREALEARERGRAFLREAAATARRIESAKRG